MSNVDREIAKAWAAEMMAGLKSIIYVLASTLPNCTRQIVSISLSSLQARCMQSSKADTFIWSRGRPVGNRHPTTAQLQLERDKVHSATKEWVRVQEAQDDSLAQSTPSTAERWGKGDPFIGKANPDSMLCKARLHSHGSVGVGSTHKLKVFDTGMLNASSKIQTPASQLLIPVRRLVAELRVAPARLAICCQRTAFRSFTPRLLSPQSPQVKFALDHTLLIVVTHSRQDFQGYLIAVHGLSNNLHRPHAPCTRTILNLPHTLPTTKKHRLCIACSALTGGMPTRWSSAGEVGDV